jgi:hypothetical protein
VYIRPGDRDLLWALLLGVLIGLFLFLVIGVL